MSQGLLALCRLHLQLALTFGRALTLRAKEGHRERPTWGLTLSKLRQHHGRLQKQPELSCEVVSGGGGEL